VYASFEDFCRLEPLKRRLGPLKRRLGPLKRRLGPLRTGAFKTGTALRPGSF
jgi:hypothetical protein